MRAPALLLYFTLSLCAIGFSRQAPAVPQRMRDVDAKRTTLRAQAEQAYNAEMARQKAGDCLNANNTYEFNVCYASAAGIADQNLKSYEAAIRDLLGLNSPDPTPSQSVAGFDRMEQLWHSYLEAATAAAVH
jgi:hypothetical protein